MRDKSLRGVAQPGSALAWGASGRWFDSSHPDWYKEGRRSGGLPHFEPRDTFYILFSKQLDRCYIGHTTDTLEERVRKHLTNHTHWTTLARDWSVVHSENFPDKASGYRREREVKAWKKHQRIEALCRK